MLKVKIGPCLDEEGREAVNLFCAGWWAEDENTYYFLHGNSRAELMEKVRAKNPGRAIEWAEDNEED